MKLRPFDKVNLARTCTGLTITQKVILLVIASHLGKSEWSPLSLDTLQKETSITKRDCLTKNIKFLVDTDLVWKLPPSNGFKSCRYGINFNLLVTVGDWCSHLRSLDQSPTVTSAVTVGDPKRKLKSFKRKLKENPVDNSEEKAKEARQKIRAICRIKPNGKGINHE